MGRRGEEVRGDSKDIEWEGNGWNKRWRGRDVISCMVQTEWTVEIRLA